MKTIEKKTDKANKHTANANDHFKRAMEIQKRIKALITVVLLLVTVAICAQDFKPIGCLDKSVNDVMSITNPYFIRYSSGTFEGGICINRYSTDYGVVAYVLNEKNICTKILIPTMSKRQYDFTGYKVRQVKDANITVIERF